MAIISKTTEYGTFRNLKSIILHPVEGFEELRYKKGDSYCVICLLLLVWYLVLIFQKQYTGFIFNTNRPEQLNIFMLFITTVGVLILFTIINWAICTLFDGEGRLKQILSAFTYALIPFITCALITTVLSNFAIKQEGSILSFINMAGLLYSGIILFSGLMTIHQYSFKKTITSIIMTILGVFCAIFLLILLASIVQQLYIFVATIMSELSFKIR